MLPQNRANKELSVITSTSNYYYNGKRYVFQSILVRNAIFYTKKDLEILRWSLRSWRKHTLGRAKRANFAGGKTIKLKAVTQSELRRQQQQKQQEHVTRAAAAAAATSAAAKGPMRKRSIQS